MSLSAQTIRTLRTQTNKKFNEVKRLRRSLDLLEEKVAEHPNDEKLGHKRAETSRAWKRATVELAELRSREIRSWE